MAEFLNIAQLGVAGFAVFLFYKLLANHSRHVETALDRLTMMIEKLNEHFNNKL